MGSEQILNARVDYCDLEFHGDLLVATAGFQFDGCSHQGIGGIGVGGLAGTGIGDSTGSGLYAVDFVQGMMLACDVDKFTKCNGQLVRIKRVGGMVVAVGHIMSPFWYEFSDRMTQIREGKYKALKRPR